MAKGRVAQIVREACRRHNVAEMVEMLGRLATLGIPLLEGERYVVGHRLAHTRNLHRMRKTVVHKDTSGQGEDLCLVLQASERTRKDKAVVVAPEIGARGILF